MRDKLTYAREHTTTLIFATELDFSLSAGKVFNALSGARALAVCLLIM